MVNDDPLQALVSDDAKEVDRKKMADFLQHFVQIDVNSKEFRFLPDFDKLGSSEKIEIILLACKARSLLFETPEGLTHGEIIALDTMPEGTAKPTIKKLFDSKKIKKNNEGHYFLPGYRVNELIGKYSK